jgi:hypothetical protein
MKQEQEAVVVFFRRYNKVIFLLAGLLLAGLFGTQWYLNTKEREVRLSAENYDSLHEAYNNWVKTIKSKGSENLETVDALNQKMKSLRTGLLQGATPYPEIARFYETLEIVSSGRVMDFANVQINLPDNAGQANIESQLIAELQGLLIAKTLANHSEFRPKGIELLKMLVQRGEVVSVAALSALAGLAINDQEKNELKAMIPAIVQRQPWQKAEIDRVTAVMVAGEPG